MEVRYVNPVYINFELLLQVCDCQTIDEIESEFCKDFEDEIAWRLENILEGMFAAFKKGKQQSFLKKNSFNHQKSEL